MSAAPLAKVAGELWHIAPMWRRIVMAAALLTLGALLHSWMGTPSAPRMADLEPSRARPAPLRPDPASDGRLASYEAEHREAAALTNAAARCEKLAAAFARLEPSDRERGTNPAAGRARIGAVIDGAKCGKDIADSEARFKAIEQVVAESARGVGAETLARATAAMTVLNAFDRARPRVAGDAGLLARGQALVAEREASDKRIDEAGKVVAAMATGRTPPAIVAAAEAWQRLSEVDRARLTPAQRAGLAPADEAFRVVAASRARLRRVELALAAGQPANAPPPARRQLIEAVGALGEFDRAIATAEQKPALQKAEEVAVAAGLVFLKEQVEEFRRDASPSNHQRLAALLAVLRDRLPRERSTEYEPLLAVARGAVEALQASDGRLESVLRAVEAWGKGRTPETIRLVTQTLRDTTDFDRRRFEETHRRGWDRLQAADAIIRGPELLLTAATKQRLPIHVAPGKRGAADAPLATATAEALRRAGFVVARERIDAALGIEVTATRISDPTPDYRGAVVVFRVDVVVEANVAWLIDDSSYVALQVQGSGAAPQSDRSALQAAALRGAIDEFVRQLQARVDAPR